MHRVSRDGGTILHQPGQLAIYTIINLAECGLEESEFHWRLQDAILETCREAQVSANRRDDADVAINGRHGVICEIGTGIEDGVTTFGAFLNVSCRLDEAKQYGRGLKGERISSLNAERVRPTIMSQVRASLIEQICERMGYPEYHIHTGHPFLKRTQQGTAASASAESLLD